MATKRKTEEEEDFSDSSSIEREILPEELDMIRDAWRLGQSAEQVSESFDLPLEVIEDKFESLERQNMTHHDRLKMIVNDLEDQCLKTKRLLEFKQTALMLQSYQRMMSEYRIALAEMMSLERPQDVVDSIMENTFNPFVIDIVRTCTEETNRLKQEMLRLDIPLRDANGISVDIFTRLAERVKSLLPTAKHNLDTKLGVKKSDAEDRLQQDRAQAVM